MTKNHGINLDGEKLTKINLENLPEYINLNKEKFKNWLED